MKLNDEQRRAAVTLEGPVVIAAGAGSGKTTVMAERFANAVVPGAVEGWEPVDLERGLAITYTDKAAGELQERIRRALARRAREADSSERDRLLELARRADSAWISTVHGLCSRLLRLHGLAAGIDPSFEVADEIVSETMRIQAIDETIEAGMADVSIGSAATELVDMYGARTVRLMIRRLLEKLATNGLAADALRSANELDLPELMARVHYGVESAHKTLKECAAVRCGATLENALATTSACLATTSACHLAPTEDDLRELAEAFKEGGLAERGQDDVKQAVVELKELKRQVNEAVHGLDAAPHEEVLAELTERAAARLAELKQGRCLLDFNDLQTRMVALLDDEDRRDQMAARFALTMVDEFQDTDVVQAELVDRIGLPRLCTVGDERQSIYRFRNADIGVFRAHNAVMELKGAKDPIELKANYRSHPDLLAFTNALFEGIWGAEFMQLEAGRVDEGPFEPAAGPRVKVVAVDGTGLKAEEIGRLEADLLAERIELLRARGVALKDMVVLLRGLTRVPLFLAALRTRGIPAVVAKGGAFFATPEVAALRCALRLVANREDDAALVELLAGPFVGMQASAMAAALKRERDASSAWSAMMRNVEAIADQDERQRALVVIAAIERARRSVGIEPLAAIIYGIVEDLDLDLRWAAQGLEGETAWANVLKVARFADDFEASGGSGAVAFLAHLDARETHQAKEAEAAAVDETSEAVRIMSIHASKGLEFPVVFVPEAKAQMHPFSDGVATQRVDQELRFAIKGTSKGCDSEAFGRLKKAHEDAEWDELDRLYYVAFTRAKEMLWISGTVEADKNRPGPIDHIVEAAGGALAPEPTVGKPIELCVLDAADYATRGLGQPPRPEAVAPPVPALAEVATTPPASSRVPERLSFSGIEVYRTCPLQFRARHIDVLGRVVVPAQPGTEDARRFGTATHAMLQLVGTGATSLTRERREAIGRYHRLAPAEVARASAAVDAWLASDTCARLATMSATSEAPFRVPITDTVWLDGKLDLVAREGGHATVVDFKTGAGRRDETGAHERQARAYAFALLGTGADAVTVEFVFLERSGPNGPETTTFEFTTADEPALRAELVDVIERMAAEGYERTPNPVPQVCQDCVARLPLCDVDVAELRRAQRGSD